MTHLNESAVVYEGAPAPYKRNAKRFDDAAAIAATCCMAEGAIAVDLVVEVAHVLAQHPPDKLLS